MIEKLSIRNFKSIKKLKIDCRKNNLFIGEPNTGKSNILEALGVLSWCGYMNTELGEYVRIQGTQNLFYDDLLDQTVEIEIENGTGVGMRIKFKDDEFHFVNCRILKDGKLVEDSILCRLDYYSKQRPSEVPRPELAFIKFYTFERQSNFPKKESSFLMPPHGSNMFAVVMASQKLRKTMTNFFKDFDLRLVLKPQERTFEIQKQTEDIVINYPYILTSDTLQRIIFHVIAMESNENSTLVFEEPESHAFPYYTKYLGEKIAFDKTNQYFIATHNPYLLLSILEKSSRDDVNVCITYFRDYQTKVKSLNDEEISELMAYDPFANLDFFIDEEGKE